MMKRNMALDNLKSFGVLSIALFHGCFWWAGITNVVAGDTYLWVDFLFIITGLTTMMSIAARPVSESTGQYWGYLAKSRIFRLWVPYAIIWCITIATYAIFPAKYPDFFKYTEFYSYFTTFFLLQTMGLTDGGEILGLNSIGVSWPLSAEFWIALGLFPLLHKLRQRPICIIYLMCFCTYISLNMIYASGDGVVSYCGRHMGSYVPGLPLNISIGMLRCLVGFALGVLVYYAKKSLELRSNQKKFSTFVTLAKLFFIGILILVYGRFSFWDRDAVVFPFVASILVLLFSFGDGGGSSTSENFILVYF